MKHFEHYNVLKNCQHGFRAKRSTELQLILTIHNTASSLQQNKSIHVVLLDFSKAFHKVPNQRLLMKLELKLELYDIHGNLLSWMESFLTRRVQTIICEGTTSPSSQVTSGVPRKSVLGTLLFLTDINNLRKSYFCFVLLVHWRRVKCISSFLCCDLLLFEIIFFCSSIHWRTLKDRGQPWLVYWMLIRLMQQYSSFALKYLLIAIIHAIILLFFSDLQSNLTSENGTVSEEKISESKSAKSNDVTLARAWERTRKRGEKGPE